MFSYLSTFRLGVDDSGTATAMNMATERPPVAARKTTLTDRATHRPLPPGMANEKPDPPDDKQRKTTMTLK
jgi:hypothetical protein